MVGHASVHQVVKEIAHIESIDVGESIGSLKQAFRLDRLAFEGSKPVGVVTTPDPVDRNGHSDPEIGVDHGCFLIVEVACYAGSELAVDGLAQADGGIARVPESDGLTVVLEPVGQIGLPQPERFAREEADRAVHIAFAGHGPTLGAKAHHAQVGPLPHYIGQFRPAADRQSIQMISVQQFLHGQVVA